MDSTEKDAAKGLRPTEDEAEAAYEAYFAHKVDEGLRDLDQGNAISHDEIKKRLACYLH